MQQTSSRLALRYIRFAWVVPILVFTLTAIGKLVAAPPLVENFRELGVEPLMLPIGLIQLACVVLFLVPRTRTIGFFLLCSYVGGIIATRWVNGAGLGPGIVLGALLWIGMFAERPSLFTSGSGSTNEPSANR